MIKYKSINSPISNNKNIFNSAIHIISKQPVDEVLPPPLKLQDVKQVRQLSSEITQSGAKLYDLLANENVDRYVKFLNSQ